MQNNDFRAKQFLPFDALKGFYDAIEYENITRIDKKILSDDIYNNLNNKINSIHKGDFVTIKYYFDFDYVETSGVIKKIDSIYRKIYILHSVIDIDNIIDIEKINY